MTLLISFFGFAGRFAGDLLTSALGWASSLLFGRVPRSHQVFISLMMAASFLWLIVVLALVLPSVASVLLATTPHPPFVDQAWLGVALLVGVLVLPFGVGLAGYLVPAEGDRIHGAAVVREIVRGYPLAPLLSGLLIFLAGVGIARKIRSTRHGWSDVHVPIVVKRGGYDRLVADLEDALRRADVQVTAGDAPWVLTLPARLLTQVAGENVRKLRPDRLVELTNEDLRIGLYPSDIAISGDDLDRTRARAAILGRLATTAAHQTTSAEGQKIEDDLETLGKAGGTVGRVGVADQRAAFDAIDARIIELTVPTDEWDILYRLRIQIERDLLAGDQHGLTFPKRQASRREAAVSAGSSGLAKEVAEERAPGTS